MPWADFNVFLPLTKENVMNVRAEANRLISAVKQESEDEARREIMISLENALNTEKDDGKRNGSD